MIRKILLILVMVCSVYSVSFGKNNKFLKPDEAFKTSFLTKKDKVFVSIDLAKDIYLSADKLKLFILKPKKIELTKQLSFPKPVEFKLKKVHVVYVSFDIPFSLLKSSIDSKQYEIQLKFQGCSKSGLCYPPIKKSYVFSVDGSKVEADTESLSETDAIANMLKTSSTWLTLVIFFGSGLLLSLTACVLPMIPILSAIIVKAGTNKKLTPFRGFFLSLVYVMAMSLTYAIAGVIAGLFGANLQAIMQNPVILVIFSLIFVGLAFSMFGYFKLELPQSLQNKINKTTEGKEKQGVLGIAIMGFLSALIVGPCVAPPLAGALAYIGQVGDAFLGGIALFVMGLGMGMPLLLIGIGAGKFMPKPGGWMDSVSKVFGLVMLGIAIFILRRVLSPEIIMFLYSVLFLGSALHLKKYKHVLMQTITTLIFLFGVSLFVGFLSGGTKPLKPYEKFTSGKIGIKEEGLKFVKVKNLQDLEEKIKASNKPIILDFWASWCDECKKLEEKTFEDSQVIAALKNFTLLKADVSNSTQEDKALKKKFGVVGPPTLIFWNKDKKLVNEAKLVGYKNPKDFLDNLQKIK